MSPTFPLTQERVSDIAAAVAGPIAAVAPLSGDASTRRFYRILLAGGGTLVAMALDGPFDASTHPQLLVGRYLESLDFPVPRLEAAVPEAGLLLYEDLGDRLLQDEALTSGFGAGGDDIPARSEKRREVAALYERAIDLIVRLQTDGTRNLPAEHPSSKMALDTERFLYELRFFHEHYVTGLRGLRFGNRESEQLEGFFRSLAGAAAEPPWVLCHRDFHSRNLMVQAGKLRLVDFQDARLGPAAYDLASLLRDSYVVLAAEERERLLDSFLDPARGLVPDPRRFRNQFDVVALQRNLKAIGTFAYQLVVAKKEAYLPHIEPTWTYVFETLERLPAWREIVPILEVAAGR